MLAGMWGAKMSGSRPGNFVDLARSIFPSHFLQVVEKSGSLPGKQYWEVQKLGRLVTGPQISSGMRRNNNSTVTSKNLNIRCCCLLESFHVTSINWSGARATNNCWRSLSGLGPSIRWTSIGIICMGIYLYGEIFVWGNICMGIYLYGDIFVWGYIFINLKPSSALGEPLNNCQHSTLSFISTREPWAQCIPPTNTNLTITLMWHYSCADCILICIFVCICIFFICICIQTQIQI